MGITNIPSLSYGNILGIRPVLVNTTMVILWQDAFVSYDTACWLVDSVLTNSGTLTAATGLKCCCTHLSYSSYHVHWRKALSIILCIMYLCVSLSPFSLAVEWKSWKASNASNFVNMKCCSNCIASHETWRGMNTQRNLYCLYICHSCYLHSKGKNKLLNFKLYLFNIALSYTCSFTCTLQCIYI